MKPETTTSAFRPAPVFVKETLRPVTAEKVTIWDSPVALNDGSTRFYVRERTNAPGRPAVLVNTDFDYPEHGGCTADDNGTECHVCQANFEAHGAAFPQPLLSISRIPGELDHAGLATLVVRTLAAA